jgi:hypothetical protein
MDAATKVALVGVGVTLVGVIVTLVISIIALVQARRANKHADRSATAAEGANEHADRSATASERAADASQEQTEIQRELNRRGAEPSLWVDIRPDDQQAQALILLVGNSGPSVATEVVVTFDPPLGDSPAFKGPGGHAGAAEKRLNAGLSSLPPGRTLSWLVGLSHRVIAEDGSVPLSHTVTIDANSPFGVLERLTYTIDLNDWGDGDAGRPPGTLHGVTRAVRELTEAVGKGKN